MKKSCAVLCAAVAAFWIGSVAPVVTFANDNPSIGQSGSVSLSWAAPTTRADGTPLSLAEIAGYTLYYLTSEGTYSIDINDASTTSLIVSDLPAGTCYFVMIARDASGNESDYSRLVSRQIP